MGLKELNKLKLLLEDEEIKKIILNNDIRSVVKKTQIRKILDNIFSSDLPEEEIMDMITDNQLLWDVFTTYLEVKNESLESYLGDSIKMYLRDIGQYYSLDNERELLLKCKNGDIEARNKVIEHNLKFVVSIAKRYVNRGLPLEDLIQEGNIGLITALDHYEYDKNVKFITYAYFWIRRDITRALYGNQRIIRVSKKSEISLIMINKAIEDLTQTCGDDFTNNDIALLTGLKESRVKELRNIPIQPISLDYECKEDGDKLLNFLVDDNIEDNDMRLMRIESRKKVIEILKDMLNEREMKIIYNRFGFSKDEKIKTFSELSEELNISRQRIQQIETSACKRLQRNCDLKQFVSFI